MAGLLGGLIRFTRDAEAYKDLMRIEDSEIRIEIHLIDSGESATLIVGQEISVMKDSVDLDLRLTMEKQVFDSIQTGDADFGALIGRSKMTDVRPINGEFLNQEKIPLVMEVLKTLMTLYFTPGKTKMKQLRNELGGDAHGAHPIPLVYWDNIRFAWYLIRQGEVLNEAEERDPYPQVVVVLEGKGIVRIGDERFELEPKMVLYVPRNVIHQIEASEDVEVIWLAWLIPP